ncbi:MAG: bifunctional diguanylate cyclase/phosphodiesterase [Gammaproteobacteria bacterium]|nr:bifunctional diguanylate cyclase/phosphodiesterase [Gammaproteobacteria bacterium]
MASNPLIDTDEFENTTDWTFMWCVITALVAALVHIARPLEYGRTAVFLVSFMYTGYALINLLNPERRKNGNFKLIIALAVAYPLSHLVYVLAEWGAFDMSYGAIAEIVASLTATAYTVEAVREYEYRTNSNGFAVDLILVYVGFWLFAMLLFYPDVVAMVSRSGVPGLVSFIGLVSFLGAIPVAIGFGFYSIADRNKHLLDMGMAITLAGYFALQFFGHTYPDSQYLALGDRVSLFFYNFCGVFAMPLAFRPPRYKEPRRRRPTVNRLLIFGCVVVLLSTPAALTIAHFTGRDPSLISLVVAATTGTTALVLRIIFLLRDEARHHERSRQEALHDELTGIFNRRGLLTWLDDQPIEQIGMAYIDVDDFKAVNDFLGHQGGDEILIKIARGLQNRACLACARIGGDEFVVLFKHDDIDIELRGRRLREMLCGWHDVGGSRIYVTVTVGIAGDGYANVDELVRAADTAMYQAKRERLGVVASTHIASEVENRQWRRQRVLVALEEPIIPVHLQPIYQLNGRLDSFEALARLYDRKNGQILTPDRFLDVVKNDNLEEQLTEKLVMSLRALPERVKNHKIAINVNPHWISRPDSIKLLHGWLQAAGREVEKTTIEIIEDDADLSDLSEAIFKLRAYGYSVALDDFGTGYTSMSRVGDLPIETLKIDRTLIDSAVSGSSAAFQSAVELGRKLGAQLVVEGVSTPAHLRLAQEFKIDKLQGFLLGRPVPMAETASVPELFNMRRREADHFTRVKK